MIFLVLVLATFLRLINLDQSLWLDEATQAMLSQNSLYSIIYERAVDFHPPLSYLIMHFWIQLGTSEIWLRMLSLIFGVGTVWMTYKFTKLIFNKNIATLSAILLAINPYHIYYSQEVRMYSQAAFFGLLSMYFLILLLSKQRFLLSTGFILSTAALIYTHYDGLFLIGAQIVYLLIVQKEKIKNFLLYELIVFLLYIPWIPQFIIQLKNGLSASEYLPGWENVLTLPFFKAIPLTIIKFSFGRIDLDYSPTFIVLTLIILMSIAWILFRGLRNFKDSYILVALWLFIPIASALIISLKIPLNQPFRILFVIPAFCILLSLGIFNFGKLRKLFLGILLTIFLTGLILYYVNPKYQREDWRGASEFILEKIDNNSLVLFAWPQPSPPYFWYAKDKNGLGVVVNFPAKRNEIEDKLYNLEEYREVYAFEYLQDLSDPQKLVQEVIEEKGFRLVKVYDFHGVGFIDHYVKQD